MLCEALAAVSVFLFHLQFSTELLQTTCAESEDTLNAFTSPTGCEPNFVAFDEFYDTSVPFSLLILSSDQDMDDLTRP